MTMKLQIKHGAFQKVYHLHNGIFHSIQLCHTLSILLNYFPCVIPYTLLGNYRMREKKTFRVYRCLNVSRYIEGDRKSHP